LKVRLALPSESGGQGEDLERIVASKKAKAATTSELMATDKYLANLHGECDFLLQYWEVRSEARTGEIEALKNAKNVLKGVDVSEAPSRQHRLCRTGVSAGVGSGGKFLNLGAMSEGIPRSRAEIVTPGEENEMEFVGPCNFNGDPGCTPA